MRNRPLVRAQPTPFQRRLSFLWSDVQEWKWWPRIGVTYMLGLVVLAICCAVGIIDYKGRPGTAEEKCWNWGGRSDDTWNC